MINTKKVKGRPNLKFTSLSAILAHAQTLAKQESSNSLAALGNWTLGQTINHLAISMDFAVDGPPAAFANPPWALRVVGRLIKRRICHVKMAAGVRMPNVPGGAVGIDPLPTDQALEKLKNSIAKFQQGNLITAHPMFGKMTREDYIGLNCRHAELHLSFFVPKSQVATNAQSNPFSHH